MLDYLLRSGMMGVSVWSIGWNTKVNGSRSEWVGEGDRLKRGHLGTQGRLTSLSEQPTKGGDNPVVATRWGILQVEWAEVSQLSGPGQQEVQPGWGTKVGSRRNNPAVGAGLVYAPHQVSETWLQTEMLKQRKPEKLYKKAWEQRRGQVSLSLSYCFSPENSNRSN